ncbi:SDR family NAD(P)-dependent oxidoreductase [Massilia sp. CMS3.1]|uniref:SDR family NAD(P)-dependent oxidoreductase n=1 Tax=Massilia sp. CMS3.1 TaxID=3373083 RepID=UPI003EE5441B
MKKMTWLITNCSSDLGRHLAAAVLARGDQLIATARQPEALQALMQRFPETVRVCVLNLTRPEMAQAAVGLAVKAFGGLDVLVNNAGYGMAGAIEEDAPDEYRPVFEVNVFGLIEVTRAALPVLRRRPGGRIVNFSSTTGIAGSVGSGYYVAAKFAVEGLSEALDQEVRPLGLRVIIVEHGPLRTASLGRSVGPARRQIRDYDRTVEHRIYREHNDGKQVGDPAKAVAVILRAVDSAAPPLHLPLGPMDHAATDHKLGSFSEDIDAWRQLAIASDFD